MMSLAIVVEKNKAVVGFEFDRLYRTAVQFVPMRRDRAIKWSARPPTGCWSTILEGTIQADRGEAIVISVRESLHDRIQSNRRRRALIRTAESLVARARCLAVFLAAAVTGCGSGNGPLISGTGVLLPDFDSIQANIFTPECSSCHIGATAPLGLRLDTGNSYDLLVGRASVQESGLLRVAPGDPNASYLIRKLEGSVAVGGQMPLGAPPIAQARIDVVRQWITNGALRSPAPTPQNPLRVTSVDPLPESTVPMLPMTVTAIFDRELNAASVDVTTFQVVRSGGDGTFADGNEVTIVPDSIEVPLINPRTAVFDMSSAAPVEDDYRITLVGTGQAVIQDLDANALDGEFSGAFPSGNGTEGGNFVADFSVAGVQPTLLSIQDNVFTPLCSGCHSGPSSNNVGDLPSGMDLSSLSLSFMSLVGVSSLQNGAVERVNSGNPDDSYLIRKLEGSASMGGQMPLGGPALEQATIDVIRQWISDGAAM
jgi:hypothetical protein